MIAFRPRRHRALAQLEERVARVVWPDGNPLEDIRLVADPDRNFLVIMKDGKIYKDTLPR